MPIGKIGCASLRRTLPWKPGTPSAPAATSAPTGLTPWRPAAAADLGIGTAHSSVGDQDAARKILGVPDDHDVTFLLGVGYPADRPLRPIAQPDRRPAGEVIHHGRW